MKPFISSTRPPSGLGLFLPLPLVDCHFVIYLLFITEVTQQNYLISYRNFYATSLSPYFNNRLATDGAAPPLL